MAVGIETGVGASTTGVAVNVGSGVGVGDGSEVQPTNAPSINAKQTTETNNFKFTPIYLFPRCLSKCPAGDIGRTLPMIADASPMIVVCCGINNLQFHI